MYPQEENKHIEIDHVSRAYILETVRWTKFLAILGFIFIGLMLLVGLLSTLLATVGLSFNIIAGLWMLLAAAIYFYPIYALIKFSSNMKMAMNISSQMHFNEGLRYQKSMYKYIGIITIITLILYLLGILFFLFVFGGFAAMYH